MGELQFRYKVCNDMGVWRFFSLRARQSVRLQGFV